MIKQAIMPLNDYVDICDKIREKTETTDLITSGELSEKINDVYEVGKNAEWNEIKGTASGEIISINDVSPIEHEMGVKVSGKNLPDISAVKVSRLGKNVFDFNSASGIFMEKGNDGSFTQNKEDTRANLQLVLNAFKNGEFVKHLCALTNIYSTGRWACTFENDETFDTVNFGHNGLTTNIMCTFPMPPMPKGAYTFSVLLTNVTQGSFSWKDIQIEAGMETEYEPYIQPTEYTPDTDGIVQGVTSLYPSTTLMTDTDGAVIDATFNKELSKVDDIPERIEDIYVEGQMVGHTQAEREMWDAITANNTRKDISLLFAESNFEYIRPPYKIIPTAATTLNQPFAGAKNLKKVESDYFDFSQKKTGTCSQAACYYTFYNCSEIEEIEDLGIQPEFGYYTTYANCTKLKKIACIRSDENTLYNGEVFNYCYALEDITFEGVIGQNGLNFRWNTKLTYDSCHSIFTHLKDFRTTIVENYADADTGNRPYELATHALTEGDKYCLIYESDNAIYKAEATVQSVNVAVSGVSAMGLQFEFPQEEEGEVPLAWVYQDGEKLMYDSYFYRPNGKFTLIKGATETRTITMPKAVKDNGNATPEDIAEATERGWTIVWS